MTTPAAMTTAGQPNAVWSSPATGGAPLSDTARRVLAARYLRRAAAGELGESRDELFQRVARSVAHAELLLGNGAAAAQWEQRFYAALAALDFLPNSLALMNAGTALGQLFTRCDPAACRL